VRLCDQCRAGPTGARSVCDGHRRTWPHFWRCSVLKQQGGLRVSRPSPPSDRAKEAGGQEEESSAAHFGHNTEESRSLAKAGGTPHMIIFTHKKKKMCRMDVAGLLARSGRRTTWHKKRRGEFFSKSLQKCRAFGLNPWGNREESRSAGARPTGQARS